MSIHTLAFAFLMCLCLHPLTAEAQSDSCANELFFNYNSWNLGSLRELPKGSYLLAVRLHVDERQYLHHIELLGSSDSLFAALLLKSARTPIGYTNPIPQKCYQLDTILYQFASNIPLSFGFGRAKPYIRQMLNGLPRNAVPNIALLYSLLEHAPFIPGFGSKGNYPQGGVFFYSSPALKKISP